MRTSSTNSQARDHCPDCGRLNLELDYEANECLGCGRSLGSAVAVQQPKPRGRRRLRKRLDSRPSEAPTGRAAVVGSAPGDEAPRSWSPGRVAAPSQPHTTKGRHRPGTDCAETRREVLRPDAGRAQQRPTTPEMPKIAEPRLAPEDDQGESGASSSARQEPDLDLSSARRDDAHAFDDSLLEVSGLRARRRNMAIGSIIFVAATAAGVALAMM